MSYAIDLNQRQSARTLEQAVRYQATVFLEPRVWAGGEAVRCQLEACELSSQSRRLYAAPLVLVTCPEGEPAETAASGLSGRAAESKIVERYSPLIGTYCDATVEMGENLAPPYIGPVPRNRPSPSRSTVTAVRKGC